MEQNQKRKADDVAHSSAAKRQKKQWRVPRQTGNATTQPQTIQPGDSGIWATCDKGREGKCIGELRDLFAEYADALYGGEIAEDTDDEADGSVDIENDVENEINELHEPAADQLFTPIRIDVQCVVFFKTRLPVDPVALVKRICEEAMNNQARKRTRFVKRLSPMTLIGRASEDGLEKVATTVLAPYFHQQPPHPQKFAIRPTLRNHNVLSRDGVINQVAKLVGPGHKVDLKDYDLLIAIEVYKNICGVSVLDRSFEAMKRFNLSEIYNPTPKDDSHAQPSL